MIRFAISTVYRFINKAFLLHLYPAYLNLEMILDKAVDSKQKAIHWLMMLYGVNEEEEEVVVVPTYAVMLMPLKMVVVVAWMWWISVSWGCWSVVVYQQ